MQLFLDFLPVAAFFLAYPLGGIYVATATLMVCMVLLCTATWLRTRKVGGLLLTATTIALIAGTLTLVLHNAAFIKWKLTLLDAVFALAFFIVPYVSDKTLVERVMGAAIKLEPAQWRVLNFMWIGFFVFTASLNVYVLSNFSEATWVKFKFYGATITIPLVFALIQALWLSNKLPKEAAAADETAGNQQINGS